ncbi:hypothetical protein E4A41_07825, partial [Micrococcus endophyticus]
MYRNRAVTKREHVTRKTPEQQARRLGPRTSGVAMKKLVTALALTASLAAAGAAPAAAQATP